MTRVCIYCRVVELTGRSDQRTCSQECRQALARYRAAFRGRAQVGAPAALAFADPPYPGKAWLYKGHPDFAGEVDHAPLLAHLQRHDGWGLATDEPGLRAIEHLLVGVEHRKAVWLRGVRPGPCAGPAAGFEFVLYRPARAPVSRTPVVDTLVYTSRPRLTNPARVIGAKPAAYWSWVFGLLGAQPGDRFDDLFPGSGAGALAWAMFEESARRAA